MASFVLVESQAAPLGLRETMALPTKILAELPMEAGALGIMAPAKTLPGLYAELQVVQQAASAAAQEARRLQAEEEAAQSIGASVRALEQECWDLEEKKGALEEDLADRALAGEALERHLAATGERLRQALAERQKAEAEAKETCKELTREVEQLETEETRLLSEVASVTAELRSLRDAGPAPGPLGAEAAAGELVEAQRSFEAAQASLAREERALQEVEATTKALLAQQPRSLHAALGPLWRKIEDLQAELEDCSLRTSDLLTSARTLQEDRPTREVQVQEVEVLALRAEGRAQAAEEEAAALSQRLAHAIASAAVASPAVAAAALGLQTAEWRHRAARAAPVLASFAASLWWVAAAPL